MSNYRKLFVAIATAVVGAIAAFAVDGNMTTEEWINVVILVVGAVRVYYAENTPNDRYAKAIAAGITAVATTLISLISDGITTGEFWQLVAAFAGAFVVREVANQPST